MRAAARSLRNWLPALCACIAGFVSPSVSAQDVNAGPYVPTPQYIVDRMLQMANVGANDYVIDLGSGDGRIVITAAKQFGARGMGVDISEQLVGVATTNAHKEQVAERAKFVQQDAFKTDIRAASVLTLYLLPKFVLELRPKILAELKPGSRIVSHDYNLGDWESDNAITFDSPEKAVINGSNRTSLFYYVVPAHVAGTWQFSFPEGLPERTVQVSLQQSYQRISGNTIGANAVPLRFATLRGERIELAVPMGKGDQIVSGVVKGDRIEGSIELRGKGKLPFTASRTANANAIGW
ncbi:MAG: class I SAM-dependent methyltransferase [Nitrospira sp.]|nr:class I SAM-dependent methyltransferase [Nitrospira sp.]